MYIYIHISHTYMYMLISHGDFRQRSTLHTSSTSICTEVCSDTFVARMQETCCIVAEGFPAGGFQRCRADEITYESQGNRED